MKFIFLSMFEFNLICNHYTAHLYFQYPLTNNILRNRVWSSIRYNVLNKKENTFQKIIHTEPHNLELTHGTSFTNINVPTISFWKKLKIIFWGRNKVDIVCEWMKKPNEKQTIIECWNEREIKCFLNQI